MKRPASKKAADAEPTDYDRMALIAGAGFCGMSVLTLLAGLILGGGTAADGGGGGGSARGNDAASRIDYLFGRMTDGTFAETYFVETAPSLHNQYTKKQYASIAEMVNAEFGPLVEKELLATQKRKLAGDEIVQVKFKAKFQKQAGIIMAEFQNPGWKVRALAALPDEGK